MGLGPNPGPQGPSNAGTSILLSLRGRSDPFISWLVRCRPWPCTIRVGHFVVTLAFVHLNLRPWQPRSCTWVVSGMFVRFIIYMVKLTSPNHTQVDGNQRARWPPTTQTPSHRTRQPSESMMAAYHTDALAPNQAAIRERDGRLPRRAAYHTRTPPYEQHGPHLAPHPPVKPRGQQTEARQPIST